MEQGERDSVRSNEQTLVKLWLMCYGNFNNRKVIRMKTKKETAATVEAILKTCKDAYISLAPSCVPSCGVGHLGYLRIKPNGEVYSNITSGESYGEDEYYGRSPHELTIWLGNMTYDDDGIIYDDVRDVYYYEEDAETTYTAEDVAKESLGQAWDDHVCDFVTEAISEWAPDNLNR